MRQDHLPPLSILQFRRLSFHSMAEQLNPEKAKILVPELAPFLFAPSMVLFL